VIRAPDEDPGTSPRGQGEARWGREVIQEKLRHFILSTFKPLDPAFELGETDDLVDQGILDSIAFVELVEEVQTRFGVEVADVDIVESNFGCLAALTTYISGRLGDDAGLA
jgi:acyl carrier protein